MNMEEQKNEPGQTYEEPKKEPVKEVIHHYHERKRGINFGRLFLGIIIILIGLAVLGQNTGWFNLNLADLWQFWPLLIIFFGLSLLAGRGVLPIIVGIVLTALVILIIGFVVFGNFSFDNASRNITKGAISIDKKSGVESAVLEIKTGAGRLNIEGGSDKLVSGIHESNFFRYTTSSEVDDQIQTVTLTGEGSWTSLGQKINNLDLKLNNELPMKLDIDSGAIDMDVDLSSVMAELIDIQTGASSLDIELGDKVSSSEINIKAGASSVNLTLPDTVGAKLEVTSGLSSKTLPDFKQIDENHFESDNYSTAEKKVNMDFDLGATSLTVQWKAIQ